MTGVQTCALPISANLFLPLEFLANKVGVSGRANLLVSVQVHAMRRLSRWDDLRNQLAGWLWDRAPRPRDGQTGATTTYYPPYPSSFAARAAGALLVKEMIPLPDKLALPWLDTELARAWRPAERTAA